MPAYSLQDLICHRQAEERDLLFKIDTKWEAIKPDLAPTIRKHFSIFAENTSTSTTSIVVNREDAIFWVDSYKLNCNINMVIYAKTRKIAEDTITKIKKIIPQAPEPSDKDISVRFWYLTNNGPVSVHRNIAAPTWDNMDNNYTAKTKNGLNHLMNDFRPTTGGKLILWHGEPGTGKTYALRALCQAWKSWCSSEYILDPETLLGASPGYLANMIMDASATFDDDDDEDERQGDKWKLLIMEDTGELLTENARIRAGQGLSRLLNVVDGFIGQGLRVLVLITTNEEFDTLHPAVSREGRCAASVKFNPLNLIEAKKFLKANNVSTDISKSSYNLSELYALLKEENMPRDTTGKEASAPLGFRLHA